MSSRAAPAAPDLLFRWLGVAGIELRAGGETLLTDPFLSRPPLVRMLFGRVSPHGELLAEYIPRGDSILVTHAHWDHLMDVPEIAARTGARVVGSPHTCRLLAVCGVDEQQIHCVQPGDHLQCGPFAVEVLPATHLPIPGFGPRPLPRRLRTPLRLRDYRMDCCFSFWLEVGGLRMLDWRSVYGEPARPADVLFLGMEARPQELARLLAGVRPRLVIPVHWDDFFRPLQQPLRPGLQRSPGRLPLVSHADLPDFARRIEALAPGARVIVPELFQAYDLADVLAAAPGS